MLISKVPKTYKGHKVKVVKSREFVAHWDEKKKMIWLNYFYVTRDDVDRNDVIAVMEHELEEERQKIKNKKPMIEAHQLANKKEKSYLKKHGESFPEHQKEVMNTYRTEATEDAPYKD